MESDFLKGIVVFIVAILVFGAIAGAAYYFYFVKAGGSLPVKISIGADMSGVINFVDMDSGIISLKTQDGDKNLTVGSDTKLFDDNNHPVDLGFYQKGFGVEVKGGVIKAINLPSIIVLSPKPNDLVGDSFLVRGKARVFENQFNVRVVSGGQTVSETSVTSSAQDTGLFGDFTQTINIANLNLDGSEFTLEVFDKSAKDGSEIDKVSIPLKYGVGDYVGIKLFFGNDKLGSDTDCGKVFPVSRNIRKVAGMGRASVGELLKGPTDSQKSDGYFTNINAGTKIQSLSIMDGIANVDFNDSLEAGGGSCRVAAIRAQISETLKQFPGISDVVISINGNSTSTLQP